MTRQFRIFASACAVLLITACGQKGPLFVPEDPLVNTPPTEQTAPVEDESQPSQNDNQQER